MPEGLKKMFSKACGVFILAAALASTGSFHDTAQAGESEKSADAMTSSDKPWLNRQSTSLEALRAARGYNFQDGAGGVVTIMHVNDWRYGDFFGFVDLNEKVYYAEIAPRFSLGKITGRDLSWGLIKDFLLAVNIEMPQNMAVRYLGGIGLDIEVPGFQFVQLNAYMRDNPILPGKTGQVTLAWGAPFSVSGHKFLFSGFADFAGREGPAKSYVLAQPQLWWDAGHEFGWKAGSFYVGTEVQYWHNKFGVGGVTDVVPQFGIKLTY